MIADTTRNFFADWIWEIQQADGTTIGTIMATGVGFGPPRRVPRLGCRPLRQVPSPLQAVPVPFSAFAVKRAFRRSRLRDARHQWQRTLLHAEHLEVERAAFSSPSFLLLPLGVLNSSSGPLVLHSSDFSELSATKPAVPGEVLTLIATGLGPTNPGVDPGQQFPASPLARVSSPVEATLNGGSAEVLYAGGYPGSNSVYQVNLRLPANAQPGIGTLLLVSAWQQSAPIQIPVGAGQ